MYSSEEWEVVWLSVQVGVLCVAISLPPAVFLGWVLARGSFRGKVVLDGVCHLPLVLPPVVTGYGLLLLFGRKGPLGILLDEMFGVQVAFTWKGAVLAASVVGFPLMLRAVRLAIEGVDTRLEWAARTLGAGRLRTFFTVTLPLAFPGLLVGALLSFARSLGEFGATITFVSNIAGETRTLPLAIFTLLNRPDGDAGATRLALLSVGISLLALIGSEWVTRKFKMKS